MAVKAILRSGESRELKVQNLEVLQEYLVEAGYRGSGDCILLEAEPHPSYQRTPSGPSTPSERRVFVNISAVEELIEY